MVAQAPRPGKQSRGSEPAIYYLLSAVARAKAAKFVDTAFVEYGAAGFTMPSRKSYSMRISGGASRGFPLKGAVAAGVRPTTERVRSAIFNILQPDKVVDARVLDLYAGTGSLGIEALSRGAQWADFVERNRRQCQVIQENLDFTGYRDASRVTCAEVLDWLNRSAADPNGTGSYDLVVLDPPYRMGKPTPTLERLAQSGLLGQNSTIVVGFSSRITLPADIVCLHEFDRRSYGDNAVGFYAVSAPAS